MDKSEFVDAEIYLDGEYVGKSMQQLTFDQYYYFGAWIGPLSGGKHSITVIADPENEIEELNESDNEKTIEFDVKSSGIPNLSFENHPDFDNTPLVLSLQKDSKTSDDGFYETDTMYLNFAVTNSSLSDVDNPFEANVYLNGRLLYTKPYVSMASGQAEVSRLIGTFGSLSVGEHSIEVRIDEDSEISEYNETDNIYTHTFQVLDGNVVEMSYNDFSDSWAKSIALLNTDKTALIDVVENSEFIVGVGYKNTGTTLSDGFSINVVAVDEQNPDPETNSQTIGTFEFSDEILRGESGVYYTPTISLESGIYKIQTHLMANDDPHLKIKDLAPFMVKNTDGSYGAEPSGASFICKRDSIYTYTFDKESFAGQYHISVTEGSYSSIDEDFASGSFSIQWDNSFTGQAEIIVSAESADFGTFSLPAKYVSLTESLVSDDIAIFGDLDFCDSTHISLTAPKVDGASILWTTGETTETILVGPGTYTYTVTAGSCSETHAGVTIAESDNPCLFVDINQPDGWESELQLFNTDLQPIETLVAGSEVIVGTGYTNTGKLLSKALSFEVVVDGTIVETTLQETDIAEDESGIFYSQPFTLESGLANVQVNALILNEPADAKTENQFFILNADTTYGQQPEGETNICQRSPQTYTYKISIDKFADTFTVSATDGSYENITLNKTARSFDVAWKTGYVGNATIQVTAVDNTFGKIHLPPLTVTLPEPLVAGDITVEGDLDFCENDEVSLSADVPDGLDVVWSDNQNGKTVSVGPGSYIYRVVNGNCSAISEEITIDEVADVVVNLDLDKTLLCGDETITAKTDKFVLWDNGKNTTSMKIDEPGTYWYAYENRSCGQIKKTFKITKAEPEQITITASEDVICPGEKITLSAGRKVKWSTRAFGPSITVTKPGTYTAQDPDANAECPMIGDEIEIKQSSLPESIEIVESGNSLSVADAGSNEIIWYVNDQKAELQEPLMPGIYVANVTGKFGCEIISPEHVVEALATSLSQANNEIIITQTKNQYIVYMPQGQSGSFSVVSFNGSVLAQGTFTGNIIEVAKDQPKYLLVNSASGDTFSFLLL